MSARGSSPDDEEEISASVGIHGNKATEVQRLRLERLMANPEKPAHIPDRPKDRAPPPPAEYVRFYMGSSAGAGSGEFHIYRNLRRKEQNRMKYIEEQAKKDEAQTEFEKKAAEQQRLEDLKSAKSRAKRLKKKAKQQAKRSKGSCGSPAAKEPESDSSDIEDEEKSVPNQLSQGVSGESK
ncbi:hypothetical protein RvY_10045 [Ramazzottius varieornatus]|uniref:PRKR-interacting protein 1 homolog n=1 Tax=Ramazzottius varieornatus TaxID=947166 RepID=A0A1D1VBG0_RAMVA|nr:hypothetical protein RvY_10045 [Ramazzottius varieornatus]